MNTNVKRAELPSEALEPQRGYQEMQVTISARNSIVEYTRMTDYDLTELEIKTIKNIKSSYHDSIKQETPESQKAAYFDYQQEQLRQKRIDRIVDEYLTPDNNKPRKHSDDDDDESAYFDTTGIACLILSAIMAIVMIIGNYIETR